MSDPPAFDDAQIIYLDEHYGGASSQNVHWIAVNLIAALATTAWVVCTMGPFFYLLYWTNSLRVSMDKEIDGLDEDKHGGAASVRRLAYLGQLCSDT
jgi:ammonia channel protein AmtB